MPQITFTDYFEREVLRKRAYLRREWCIRALKAPIRTKRQDNGRFRFWIAIPKLNGRVLRVVTEPDQVTIPIAFLDRRFKP